VERAVASRTVLPRDVSRTPSSWPSSWPSGSRVSPCLALASPPFLRLSPSLLSDRHSNRQASHLVAPKPYHRAHPDRSKVSNSPAHLRVCAALHKPQPHMARAVHSPLPVKLSSGFHHRYRKEANMYMVISFCFSNFHLPSTSCSPCYTSHFDLKNYHRALQHHSLTPVALALNFAHLIAIQLNFLPFRHCSISFTMARGLAPAAQISSLHLSPLKSPLRNIFVWFCLSLE